MEQFYLKRQSDPGYIIGWKYRYEFKAGQYPDEVMTYGEAKQRAEELNAEHPDMTFWPQQAKSAPSRFDKKSQEEAKG